MALRIGGLASGMDTESIVKELMKVQSMKLDKYKQQKTKTEWKRDAYREYNTQLLDFRTKLTNMKLSTTFRSRTTASSDDTRVSATATSAAGLGSFTMNSVSQLATAAFRTGSNIGREVTNPDTNTTTVVKASTNTALYKNSTIQGADNDALWKQGSVGSKILNSNGSNQVDLGIKLDELAIDDNNVPNGRKLSDVLAVKVGSVNYEVVSDSTASLDPSKKQVKLTADGQLIFSEDIKAGSNITANFVKKEFSDTVKKAENSNAFTLSKKGVTSASFDLELNFDKKKDEGVAPSSIELTILGSKVIVKGDALEESVGTFDAETGKITLNEGFLPSNSATITTSYTYESQKYTTTSLEVKKGDETVSETFFFSGDSTIDQIVNTVNASNLGVSMFFDSHTNQMTMTRKETGESDIRFTGVSDANTKDIFMDLFKFDNNLTDASKGNNGQNAEFNLNGLTTQRTTNNFTINGVNFTLKKTFLSGEGAVTVGVNNDVDAVVKNIKDFVDSYNKLVESINLKVTERVNRAYAPPTDEEKAALSEKQLEEWLTQAKSGLLRNDSILNSTLSGMRMDFYGAVSNSGVDSVYNQLTQIGISTTANYLDGGKLEINETKLRAALEADPAGVEALFNASGSTSSSKGILNRLTDTVNGAMDRLKEKAGNSFSTNQTFALGREIDSVTKQIERWEDRLKTMEDRYWKQFSAMEKAIQNANAQSASIAQFFTQQ